MRMVGKVRLVVEVPFDADIDPAPRIELETTPRGSQALKDPHGHEKAMERVEKQRAKAAKQAEADLVDRLAKAVGQGTRVVRAETVVEEVREA